MPQPKKKDNLSVLLSTLAVKSTNFSHVPCKHNDTAIRQHDNNTPTGKKRKEASAGLGAGQQVSTAP